MLHFLAVKTHAGGLHWMKNQLTFASIGFWLIFWEMCLDIFLGHSFLGHLLGRFSNILKSWCFVYMYLSAFKSSIFIISFSCISLFLKQTWILRQCFQEYVKMFSRITWISFSCMIIINLLTIMHWNFFCQATIDFSSIGSFLCTLLLKNIWRWLLSKR